jgi:soluble lytic murein transglycosylase-like protein
MKAITVAMTLVIISTPALARKADHQKRKHHHHARMVVIDAPSPFAGGPMTEPAGWNAQARTPRVARDTAPGQGAYSGMVARHAAANGVPASLVHRVIMRESRYNPRAVSKGNYGMMQIKLGTARGMGYTGTAAGLLDPEVNMTYAVKYLAGAYKVAGGSESGAVANYARGYYHQAKRQGLSPRGASPYEAPGYASFAMQSSAPERSARRVGRVSTEFYVRTPSDRHAVF